MSNTFSKRLYNVVKAVYDNIPKTGKPTAEKKEWTVVASIVQLNITSDKLDVLSLATGSKCIGCCLRSPHLITDSHAEVLARRLFQLAVLNEVINIAEQKNSDLLELSSNTCSEFSCKIHESVRLFLVVSQMPCGDASIMPMKPSTHQDLSVVEDNEECKVVRTSLQRSLRTTSNDKGTLASFNEETRAPSCNVGDDDDDNCSSAKKARFDISDDIHRTGAKCVAAGDLQDPKGVLGAYHVIGAFRTKPGRGAPSLSMSCSDKIARWMRTGLQSAFSARFLNGPIPLHGICVLGEPYDEVALRRALVERFDQPPIVGESFSFLHFKDSELFSKIRRQCDDMPSPSSVLWYRGCPKSEAAVEGRKLGVVKKSLHTRAARISVCRSEMLLKFWHVVKRLKTLGHSLTLTQADESKSYKQLKSETQTFHLDLRDTFFKKVSDWTKKPHLDFGIDDVG